jgi:hypothetical protein
VQYDVLAFIPHTRASLVMLERSLLLQNARTIRKYNGQPARVESRVQTLKCSDAAGSSSLNGDLGTTPQRHMLLEQWLR